MHTNHMSRPDLKVSRQCTQAETTAMLERRLAGQGYPAASAGWGREVGGVLQLVSHLLWLLQIVARPEHAG